MNKILVACTYHNQSRPTLHKALRSTRPSGPLDGWRCDTGIFYYDRRPEHVVPSVFSERTGEETLGGKRNAAIQYARANNYQLIAFLDDDDLFGLSWISGLCHQADEDFTRGVHTRIYHPQWNVLFDPGAFVVREHIGQDDPRFDSRDMMFYNPWSALCAFDPLVTRHQYRKHKKSDPRLSFEDWSFNLDTWCDGVEHIAVPSTYHFLRMRANSLGKATIHNTLEHTRYFKSPELIQAKRSSVDLGDPDQVIDAEELHREMKDIAEIEPQIWFWRVPKINQQYNNRAGRTADAICEIAKRMPFAKDVFWMHDHKRIGGAEKALAWVAEFLRDFKDLGDTVPHQVWIDDVSVNPDDKEATAQWGHGVTHLLRVWAQEGGGRSLHICNSGPAWQALANNPCLFDGVQIYVYVFNDDLMFPDNTMNMNEVGYHSPAYGVPDILDRPNIHLIVDSDHYGKRLGAFTGLGDKIRKIAVPVRGMPNKRKKEPTVTVDILWAGRLDHFKGIDEMLGAARNLNSLRYRFHVYGDGPKEWVDKMQELAAEGFITYGGRYDNFAHIPGEYDFFLFTSEREGMPNVVREAISSNLRVLARRAPWVDECPVEVYRPGYLVSRLHEIYEQGPPCAEDHRLLTIAACEPLAIAAFRECLV